MTASGPEKSRSQHRVRASLEMLHNERFPHSDMEKDDEIKAPPPVTEFLPMTPVTLEQLASTQPVSKRTHDKSLKGQWKQPQSVLKSQSRKKKKPTWSKRTYRINDLPTQQGEINTSWGLDPSEATNDMGRDC